MAIRITEHEDLTRPATKQAIHQIVQYAKLMSISVHGWASLPCTAGCVIRSLNDSIGVQTGDMGLTIKLVAAALPICKHIRKLGGEYSWEWPDTNLLWTDIPDVNAQLDLHGASTCRVSSAAAGLSFNGFNKKETYVKKSWRIRTTSEKVSEVLKQYEKFPEHIKKEEVVECRGKVAKESARYPARLAQAIWEAIVPKRLCGLVAKTSVGAVEFGCALNLTAARPPPRVPIWCTMVTRIVKPASSEAKCPGADAAIAKEHKGHLDKGTWDEGSVREYRDLMNDPNIDEAVIGRIFGILALKNAERMDPAEWEWKYRSVFQGNNLRTKSGCDAHDLFDEVSNAPASLLPPAAPSRPLRLGV